MKLRTWERIRDAWWSPRWLKSWAIRECNEWYAALDGSMDVYS